MLTTTELSLPVGAPSHAASDLPLPPVFGCVALARFLGVDIKTVQGMAQRRELPCRKVGRAYRFYRPAVLSWLLGPQNDRSARP